MTKVARHFFSCPVFFNLERHALKLALGAKEPKDLESAAFSKGDSVYLWRVKERTDDEILLEWSVKGYSGTTW